MQLDFRFCPLESTSDHAEVRMMSHIAETSGSSRGILTLADAYSLIKDDLSLPGRRRRDVLSALRAIARFFEEDLKTIPAECPALRERLAKINGAQHKLATKRFQNIRSSLLFAVLWARGESTEKQPLSLEWEALRQRLTNKRLRCGLSAFIHFCSDQGISPEAVADHAMEAHISHLEHQTLRANPRDAHRRACRLWNEAAVSVPGWSDQQLTLPDYRKPPTSIPWEDFPESFRADVQKYLDYLAGKDLLADRQPPRINQPKTLQLKQKQIHLLASAAVKAGYPIARMGLLENLVSKEAARKALNAYRAKVPAGQATVYIRDLAKCLLSIAKHWVHSPESYLEKLRSVVCQLTPATAGLTEKNRRTLRQFESGRNRDSLLGLPECLARQARSGKLSTRRSAVRFQMALAIEVLLMAPMRISNLLSLRSDRHLVWPSGPQGNCHIVIPEIEVKNGLPLEYPLPDSTSRLLQEYLTHWWPHLASPDSPWLFPGEFPGSHKQPATMSQQITEVIAKKTGLVMTPHQFRHLAAMLYLEDHPGEYETVRRVLGHKSMKTTTDFYTGLEMRSAVCHYDRTILRLRGDAEDDEDE